MVITKFILTFVFINKFNNNNRVMITKEQFEELIDKLMDEFYVSHFNNVECDSCLSAAEDFIDLKNKIKEII